MNEENELVDEPLESVEEERQAPPISEDIPVNPKEEPEMSEVSTLINIFFEPGRVFEDLRKKPRFILGFLIIAILSTAFLFAFQQKIGDERMRAFIVRENDKSPQMESASPAQKEQAVSIGLTIQKGITYALPFVLAIFIFIGGFLYWLGIKAMGGTASLLHGISVWIYSSFPPAVIGTVANLVILLFKSPDDIDIATSSRGLVKANPTAFFDGKDMPVVTTLISTIDIFVIWGIILAGIGLHKVGKISKGSAFAIVIILTLIGITIRVVQAMFSGNPA